MNKKLLPLLLGSIMLPTVSLAENATTLEKKHSEYLFIQVAPKGTLKALEGQADTFELTLNRVGKYIQFFTNHPARETGTMSTEKFLSQWQQEYTQDPPNASIYGIKDGQPLNTAVELSNPHYDPQNQTMTYTAHTLEGQTSTLPATLDLEEIALFIDNFCASCSSNGF